MGSNRILELKQRLEQLNRLLAHYAAPTPSDAATEAAADEAEFWAARFEEREQVQGELESLLRGKTG